MFRRTLLWASENPFLSNKLVRIGFVRRATKRFMPGEELADALKEAATLQTENRIGTVLTLLGESVSTPEEATDVLGQYFEVLDTLGGGRLDSEVSIKPTQLGLELSSELAQGNLEQLVVRAAQFGRFVWIDMEASQYVDATLDLFRALRRNHDNVGLCLQAYLYRTEGDLKGLLELNPAIRLVKGAYAEPKDVAFPKKRDVDDQFLKLSKTLLDAVYAEQARAAFATHDPHMIRRIQEAAAHKKLARGDLEFQMLYGIGERDQVDLAQEGYTVKVLISYGEEWFPWYMRRLAERPANLWFVVRKMLSS